jgi:hypothetical protein
VKLAYLYRGIGCERFATIDNHSVAAKELHSSLQTAQRGLKIRAVEEALKV